jgi:hypothetical protein
MIGVARVGDSVGERIEGVGGRPAELLAEESLPESKIQAVQGVLGDGLIGDGRQRRGGPPKLIRRGQCGRERESSPELGGEEGVAGEIEHDVGGFIVPVIAMVEMTFSPEQITNVAQDHLAGCGLERQRGERDRELEGDPVALGFPHDPVLEFDEVTDVLDAGYRVGAPIRREINGRTRLIRNRSDEERADQPFAAGDQYAEITGDGRGSGGIGGRVSAKHEIDSAAGMEPGHGIGRVVVEQVGHGHDQRGVEPSFGDGECGASGYGDGSGVNVHPESVRPFMGLAVDEWSGRRRGDRQGVASLPGDGDGVFFELIRVCLGEQNGCDLEIRGGESADGFEAIELDQARVIMSGGDVDVAVLGRVQRGVKGFFAERDVVQSHPALLDRHLPEWGDSRVLEERAHHQAVGGEEIEVSVVAVDGDDLAGIRIERIEGQPEQSGGAEEFARDGWQVGPGRLLEGVEAGPGAGVVPDYLAILEATDGATDDQRPVVGGAEDAAGVGVILEEPGQQRFTGFQIVNRHALAGERHGSVAVRLRSGQLELGVDRKRDRAFITELQFRGLHLPVAVEVTPDYEVRMVGIIDRQDFL